MKQFTPPASRSIQSLGLLVMFAFSAACSSGGGSSSGSSNTPGTVLAHPEASSSTSKSFIVDANARGSEQELRLLQSFSGRLVDIYDQDPDGTRVLQQKDFVIGSGVRDDAVNYQLETNPVTQGTNLIILHDAENPLSGYEAALRGAETSLAPINEVGLDGAGGAVISMVPRNAAIVLQFNDLLDPELVGAETVRVFSGSPPNVPFEPRIFGDTNHGDIIGSPGSEAFRTTRIIIDTTVSELESFASPNPLPVNGVGLPASVNAGLISVLIRIPSVEKASVGQEVILRNLSGHAMVTAGNGPVDFTSPTVDIVRAARSGGGTEVTGDPFNGFLRDEDPPEIIGRQAYVIDDRPLLDADGSDELDFILPRSHFLSPFCALTPQVGDVLKQAGVFVIIREEPAAPNDGVVFDMKVRLLLGDPDEWPNSAVGSAEFLSTYDPEALNSQPDCFVQILPTPDGFPLEPTVGLATDAQMTLRFSEPMDPGSLTAFDSLTLTRVTDAVLSDEFVVGRVIQSQDLQSFSFVPDLPLAHQSGTAENYFLNLTEGERGPTDLAGNNLVANLPQVTLSIFPDATTRINGGRVTRFTEADEEPPFGDQGTGPLPEWTGQHLYDLTRELIRPRPILRFEGNADRTQPVPSLHSAFPPGVQTPLSNMGSIMQTVWRYVDVGFSLTDISNYNVDVEGIWWAPVGGQVVSDFYSLFEIELTHALRLPDEFIDPNTAFPLHPTSGLKPPFAENRLNPAAAPPKIVHNRNDGYTVNPADLRTSATGIPIMPYPMNRDKPFEDRSYYTWRDTSILERGGIGGAGADVEQLCKTLMQGTCLTMSAGNVETIGLALLMEFRCWPDDEALGMNAFDISLAANSSSRPNFRAFSTGGLSQNGPVTRDPDLETTANGGFNPNSNPPGAITVGVDNSFYVGALDLITRISRTYSIWFPVTGLGITAAQFNPVITEPRPELLPNGTSIDIRFRGATAVDETIMLENATVFDGYGDYYPTPDTAFGRDPGAANPGVIFLLNDNTWHADVSDIDGSSYYQVRVTFTSNPETGTNPELSAVGLTWQQSE